ncbi:MAG TPA: DUF1501 domain-containing protein [Pirellulales bacterium]|nr:DUF1501 domain-containing protein [Pirellulales bacterium]
MLPILGQGHHLCDGLSRRELLRVGGVGLGGLTLARLLQQRAEATETQPRARAKSVIVLFNGGGIPQHETWDPKPEAPREVRGDFAAIATRTPGLLAGELMPKTALLTEKIAVIRTLVTGDNSHSTSGYQMLTGVPHIPLSRENSLPGKPNDSPPFNAIVKALRPPRGGLPSSIVLPRRLANFDGLYPWPGTNAGVLGRKYDAWLMECDPSEKNFAAPGCALPEDLPALRFDSRLSLLEQLDRRISDAADRAEIAEYDRYRQQSLDLIAGDKARTAFDISREPDRIRDRYGRTQHGQCVLLARRLVEAGVSLVQVNWASPDKKLPNNGGWDTHEKHSESLRGWLMPMMDQTYSALIEDLDHRGLLDETLVCWVAEFGHTPKFNARAGRDHWGRAFCIALAGGGIRGGVVHGDTDKHAAAPLDDVVRPCDYLATVFHLLGFHADTQVHDMEGRPLPISRGRVIQQVLA